MALTLDVVRDRLTDRLAEESTVFWSNASRTAAINDAQRMVSAVTRGVPERVVGAIGGGNRTLPFSGRPVAQDAATGVVLGTVGNLPIVGSAVVGSAILGGQAVSVGRTLVAVRRDVADALSPYWWGISGMMPRWMVIDEASKELRFTPVPTILVDVDVNVRVLPDELVQDGDWLFNGVDFMDKYLETVILYAAAILFLRERYEGDAERFYNLAMVEMQRLGHAAGELPPLPTTQESQS